MADINDIMSYISDKLSAEAEQIKSDAKEKYDAYMQSAAVQAKKQYDALMEKANADVNSQLEMAAGSARQLQAREILKIKNEAVENIIQAAKNKIMSMEDKSYEALLVSLLKKYNEGKSGEIILSQADEKRNLKLLEKEAKALGLVVSEEKANIKGGFILKYGKIEENCSIDAVFKEKKEEITDYINSNLFK